MAKENPVWAPPPRFGVPPLCLAEPGQTAEVGAAVQTAIEVAQRFGMVAVDPLLLQETNNTVVWLRPHEVIAKVGSQPDRVKALILEHRVGTALTGCGAPVARPFDDASPVLDPATGFIVTLWNRIDADPRATADPEVVGRSLREVHDALVASSLDLPDFRVDLARARRALFDDASMAALSTEDLRFLRGAFGDLSAKLDEQTFVERPLHGEPHDGNYLVNSEGIRWIDFESTCTGPLEWDLAFLPEQAVARFGEIDGELLWLLRNLNSARVATWCWLQARFPEMRAHGDHHLALIRGAWRDRQ